jgi:hypothetical protein
LRSRRREVLARLVVVAVLALAAVAAADAVRESSAEQVTVGPDPPQQGLRPRAPAGDTHGYVAVADGRLTKTRVVRQGEEVLSSNDLNRAFPVPFEEGGTFDIADLAVAPDGTLAVAVYKFPAAGAVHAGIELWKDDRLVASFEVPPGSFAGGIGFSSNGALVAAYAGDRVTLFNRTGRPEASLPLR